jgi:hypothetical protein
MAEIQHIIHGHDKVTDDALEQLEGRIDQIQLGTSWEQYITPLIERIQALEDAVTSPDNHTNQPTNDPDTHPDANRQRGIPYQRMPRDEARAHTMDALQDGNWHNVQTMADQQATRYTPAWRYYKGLYQTHLRELHREGKIMRRDSATRGALYEYATPTNPSR